MANNLLQNIRHSKATARIQKPNYKHLTNNQKIYFKACEIVNQCEYEMAKAERFKENWRNTDWGQQLLEKYSKAIDNKVIKYRNICNMTEKQEQALRKSIYCNGSQNF